MSWDPVWEDIYRSQEWGKYPGEDLIRFVARHFYGVVDRSSVRLLEVGSGTGANLWFMAREGFEVHGIDGSATAAQKAKSRLDGEMPEWRGEIKQGDMTELPYPDQYFDAVIDNEAVYCNPFDVSTRIYREMYRVVKPGGKLFSRTFASGSWGDGTGTKVGHCAWLVAEGPMLHKGYSRFTRKDEIGALMKSFKLDEVELISRTMNQGSHTIKEWIVVGHRPHDR